MCHPDMTSKVLKMLLLILIGPFKWPGLMIVRFFPSLETLVAESVVVMRKLLQMQVSRWWVYCNDTRSSNVETVLGCVMVHSHIAT